MCVSTLYIIYMTVEFNLNMFIICAYSIGPTHIHRLGLNSPYFGLTLELPQRHTSSRGTRKPTSFIKATGGAA